MEVVSIVVWFVERKQRGGDKARVACVVIRYVGAVFNLHGDEQRAQQHCLVLVGGTRGVATGLKEQRFRVCRKHCEPTGESER